MSRVRRNIDEDAVPASSGSAIGSHESHNDAIMKLQVKSRKQIDRISKLASFTEQMKFHLDLFVLVLNNGKRNDKDRASRISKLLKDYETWKHSDR
jgi:hypothetical protein